MTEHDGPGHAADREENPPPDPGPVPDRPVDGDVAGADPGTPPGGAGAVQPSRRIWDPQAGRWVDEGEIAGPADTTPPEGIPAVTPAARRSPATASVWTPALVGAAAGAIIAVVVLLVSSTVFDRDGGRAAPIADTSAGPDDASSLVDALRPSIVSVTVSRPDAEGEADTTRRSASGVILREDGVIATSASLVEGADTVVATFPNGQAVEAQVLGTDPVTDIAVVKVEGDGLPPILRASAEFVRLGEPVAVVASPAETFAAVTTGVVSQVGRPVATDGQLKLDLIQVDATGSVTPGAVVAGRDGSALALTTTIQDASGAKYAVPIDLVWTVVGQILAGEPVGHPWIGAVVTDAPGISGIPDGTTALVIAVVFRNSPASEAGLAPGEMIIAIDGEEIVGAMSLMARINDAGPGAEMTLTVRDREGNTNDVTLVIEDRPTTGTEPQS